MIISQSRVRTARPRGLKAPEAPLQGMDASDIFDGAVFIGGPPRSGTTLAVRCLNSHERFLAAVDDRVFESRAVYDYRERTGLVADLRSGRTPVNASDARRRLQDQLVAGDRLVGVAASLKTRGLEEAPPAGRAADAADGTPRRLLFPLGRFRSEGLRLCLKSPEITHVLPAMASVFPRAQFVLVYRPVLEIADSMHRLGELVKRFPVFHRRWRLEAGADGRPAPPPGVPAEWHGLWRGASDFQRCLISAAGYLRALTAGVQGLPPERRFVYDHAVMREEPALVFRRLARFLDVDAAGFEAAAGTVRAKAARIIPARDAEIRQVDSWLGLRALVDHIESLADVGRPSTKRHEPPA